MCLLLTVLSCMTILSLASKPYALCCLYPEQGGWCLRSVLVPQLSAPLQQSWSCETRHISAQLPAAVSTPVKGHVSQSLQDLHCICQQTFTGSFLLAFLQGMSFLIGSLTRHSPPITAGIALGQTY